MDIQEEIAVNAETLSHKVPWDVQRTLSIYFETPIAPSMSPEFIALAQKSFLPEEEPPGSGSVTVTGLRGVKRGETTKTQAQRLQTEV